MTDLAYRSGAEAPDGTRIPIPVHLSQEELASLIGTSLATVARTLNQLRQEGAIYGGLIQRRLVSHQTSRPTAPEPVA